MHVYVCVGSSTVSRVRTEIRSVTVAKPSILVNMMMYPLVPIYAIISRRPQILLSRCRGKCASGVTRYHNEDVFQSAITVVAYLGSQEGGQRGLGGQGAWPNLP